MGDKSKIAWTDATWNPVVGCSKVSDGCAHCYAIEMAHKQGRPMAAGGFGRSVYEGLTYTLPDGSHNWNGEVYFLRDRLGIPLKWKRPRRIFVNSMSDLFHEKLTVDEIAAVFATMALATWHQFQVLTKRSWGMSVLLSDDDFWIEVEYQAAALSLERAVGRDSATVRAIRGHVLPNVWLGTSVEHQEAADQRIPHLLKTPAAIRFLSCEPLLGPVDVLDHLGWDCERCGSRYADVSGEWAWPASEILPSHRCYRESLAPNWAYGKRRIDWIIAGGESGPKYRPMDPEWAAALQRQCAVSDVAFFFKQASGPRPGTGHDLLGRVYDAFPEPRMAVPA